MHFFRSALAMLALLTALAAAPAAGAQGPIGAAVGPCGTATGGPDSGLPGVSQSSCLGAGLVFNGPSVGRIATVIGPTIISPAFAGVVGVSAGSIFMGPGAGQTVGP
ncbi:MAG TPA: hypothetical protein VE570_00600 [Thermoleophilaceae bacterium]|jgi:hypothetical protein|nr:hypothetical protein [Thermoleophilaceae bacterium]